MVDDDATMYLYSEHYAGKGPNEVISCLDDYIKDLPQSVTALHLFTDNCFSQNKNKYLCAYLNYICNVHLMSVMYTTQFLDIECHVIETLAE